MPPLLSSVLPRVYSGCAYAAFVAASFWGVLFLADVGPLPTVDSNRSAATGWAVVIDLGLLLVFAVQHTVMARDSFKQWLTRSVPQHMERSTYVLAASLAMGLMFWQWQALPASVWDLHTQPWVLLVWVVYAVGWMVAIAATYMIDHWEFLGLRQGGWLPARPSDSDSVSRRWLYAWVRHPMMLGLLVAFWATPSMTVGHLLFAIGGTSYIAVGVRFEERDLRRHLGSAYDDYARSVPQLLPHLPGRAGSRQTSDLRAGSGGTGISGPEGNPCVAPPRTALHNPLPRLPRFSPPFSL
jgi:protein-S-isoprenylcysteine O-methyltransferase Ste14